MELPGGGLAAMSAFFCFLDDGANRLLLDFCLFA
jgi:hypothetical protein